MIVTFYGTEVSKNYAPQLLSAIAFETAFGLSRKTLVLQFYQKYPVETLLIGKQQVIGERDTGISDDTGIETLIRKTRSKGLKDEHFTTYTKQILSSEKSKNNFDVATVAKLADFKKEIVENADVVRELIETAEHIYDSIFILADGKDEKLIAMLNDITEKKVVCIEQGNKQNVFCTDDKTIYLVPNYDERSSYNTKHLCKAYNAKQMFAIPYNVNFNDACKTNNILRFLYENNDKSDSQNGDLVKSLKEIAAHVAGTSVKDMNSGLTEWDFKTLIEKKQEALEKAELNPEQVDIRTEKKHFWSRRKKVVYIRSEEELAMADMEDADENTRMSRREQRKAEKAAKKAEKATRSVKADMPIESRPTPSKGKKTKKVPIEEEVLEYEDEYENEDDDFEYADVEETEDEDEYVEDDEEEAEVFVPVKVPKTTKKATPSATKKTATAPRKAAEPKATVKSSTTKSTATKKTTAKPAATKKTSAVKEKADETVTATKKKTPSSSKNTKTASAKTTAIPTAKKAATSTKKPANEDSAVSSAKTTTRKKTATKKATENQ